MVLLAVRLHSKFKLKFLFEKKHNFWFYKGNVFNNVNLVFWIGKPNQTTKNDSC